MKNYCYYIGTLFFCWFTFDTLRAQDITVSPSILNFRVASDQAEIKTISIQNKSKKKVAFRIYLMDWQRDSLGGHIYYNPDTLPQSCAKAISFNPAYLEIDSAKTLKIEVRMEPALLSNNNMMSWGMLFLQSVPDALSSAKIKDKGMQTQINSIVRVGIHIYQTPPEAIIKAVSNIKLVTDSIQKGFVYFQMKNTGQAMLDCKVHLEMTYLSTGEEVKTNDIAFPVFPEGFRKVQLPLPKNLKRGAYSVLAVLDYGKNLPLEAIQKNILL